MKEEREKRTPLNPDITLEEIINDKGYYDINNNWNSILTFSSKPGKIYRGRVEVIILNEKNEIYMVTHKDGSYRIPGGSIEKDRSYKYQVEKESEEEARIKLGKIFNTGISYFRYFDRKYANCPIHWDGTYSKVFVAYFKEYYNGNIPDSVRDDEMRIYGKFVPYKKAMKVFNMYHKNALHEFKLQIKNG